MSIYHIYDFLSSSFDPAFPTITSTHSSNPTIYPPIESFVSRRLYSHDLKSLSPS